MTTPDIYILPEEVHLVPVDQLTEQMKSKFEYEETDFILTNSGARNTSKVIDASSALLLQEFRKPKSIPEGILTYSVLNKLNPEQALESAYKFLIKLRSEGFLIHFDEMSASGKKNPLKAGDLFTAYEIISKLPGVTDTEVYKVKKGQLFFCA
jgi:serine/threonine-protein kinase